MYQALYRKWRPRTFDDVAGQEHVTGTLKRQIISGRLSHAYLFVGTRGTGKTTCAKLLSRAVNCERPNNGNPCNECPSCRGIENGSVLDVLELDAASNNGVDNVRALREEAVFTPASAKMRVYIIDEVHMLTSSAFNALLKILEEPPEHLLFILATTELHKVPATILSRCQRFSFRRLAPPVISAQLSKIAENEGLILTPDAAEKLSLLADGSMRDALSLLDQCASEKTVDINRVLNTIGLAGNDELLKLAGAVLRHDAIAALGVLDKLFADGREMRGLLGELSSLIRDALVSMLQPDSPLLSGAFSGAELSAITEKASAELLLYCLETIKDTSYSLTRGGNPRLAVETCLILMCNERLSEGMSAVNARLSRLEANAKTVPAAAASHIPPEENPIPLMPEDNPNPPPLTEKVREVPPEAAEQPVNSEKPPVPEAAVSGDDFWDNILELLHNDKAAYTLLSNKAQVSAELKGNELIVRAGNAFAVHTIESKTIMEPLSAAAQKSLGRAVSIRSELYDNKKEDAQSKLDRLGAFGNVKFE